MNKTDDVIGLLERLIACPSVTPASAGSLDLIADLLQSGGFEVHRLPAGEVDNLLALRGEKPRLLFAGHTDVVPPGDIAQWHGDPFTAVQKDGFIYGRGAADMKSGVAAMVTAALHAAADGAADGVGIFLTSDEEGKAVDGTRHFVEWWREQGREDFSYIVVGEPSCDKQFGDGIKIGRRGSLTGRVAVHGVQEHSAYAHRGDNPAHRLIAALHGIDADWRDNLARQAAGELVTTWQLANLQSGVGADNVIPPVARAVFNFRYTTATTTDELRAKTEAHFESAASGKWQCDWEHSAEPYMMPSDAPLVVALRDIVAEKTGRTPNLTSSGGVSDGRFLRRICPQVAEFGVCNHTIHAVNECVRCDDVRALTDIYEQLIRRLL